MANVSHEVTAALAEVEKKVEALIAALYALNELHETHAFGVKEWADSLGSDFDELSAEINEDLEV